MKILIVSTALTMGGVERSSSNLANTLSQKGFQVYFLTILNQPQFFSLEDKIIYNYPNGFNKSKISFFKTIFWLRKEISNIQPDVILSFTKFYSAIVAISSIGLNQKLVISERSSPLYKWPFKINLISRIAFFVRRPNGVISQTKIASQYHQKYYGSKIKIKILPNPLREVVLYPEISKSNQILAVGRFGDSTKGFDLLVQAFSMLENKSWKLVFAGGDISKYPSFRDECIKYGVINRIEFLGKVKDLDEVYARSSIFIIPSRSEGFPNALCEAMAAGLACISFDFIAGPSEIIQNNFNGMVIENGNVKLLAKAIDNLIANKNKRTELGNNALHIRDKYKANKITNELIEFLNQI